VADDEPAEQAKLGLAAWAEQIFAPMIERRVDLGRGRTWCARWWDHPEAAVRLDALRLAWYELTAPDKTGGDPAAGYSAWWINHVDPHLITLLDGDTGPHVRLPPRPAPRQPRPSAAHRTTTPVPTPTTTVNYTIVYLTPRVSRHCLISSILSSTC
jgi:Domain of unknown function (DUF4913)